MEERSQQRSTKDGVHPGRSKGGSSWHGWHRSVAQCVHADAGWIKVKVKVKVNVIKCLPAHLTFEHMHFFRCSTLSLLRKSAKTMYSHASIEAQQLIKTFNIT